MFMFFVDTSMESVASGVLAVFEERLLSHWSLEHIDSEGEVLSDGVNTQQGWQGWNRREKHIIVYD